MKRIYIIVGLLLTLLLIGCSSAPDTETMEVTAEPEKVETIVERIDRLEIEDVIADIDMRLGMLSDNLDMKVTSKSVLSYVADPQRLHITINSTINDNANNETQLEAYADGEHMLIKTNYDPVWRKYTYANQTIDPNSLIQMYTTANFKQFYETWKDRLAMTETESDYTITLEGDGDAFKQLVLDEMRTIQGLRVDDALFELYMVKGVKIVHKFDKATNQPLSMSLFMNYLFSSESASTEHVLELNTTYRQVNQGLDIELPAEFDTQEVETNNP